MSFIRTILGDVPAGDLGVCYAHEHVVIDASYATAQNPDFLLADVERITAELRDARAAGVRAMVESMPGGGAGRNVLKLADVSRRSNVHLVCPTGLHLAKYYPPGHWGQRLSDDELAAVFVAEIEQGVDANDLAGPDVRRTPHRAGVIKTASGRDRLSGAEARLFRAAAAAHVATGCPILTHTEEGTAALEQVEVLRGAGADLRHVVLSHTDRKPDLAYHREILSTGARVEYDSAFRWKPGRGNPTLDLVVALLPEFPRQILLGMDAARRSYWAGFGGSPGLSYLLRDFVPQLLAAGLSPRDVDRIFVENPADAYSFATPRAADPGGATT